MLGVATMFERMQGICFTRRRRVLRVAGAMGRKSMKKVFELSAAIYRHRKSYVRSTASLSEFIFDWCVGFAALSCLGGRR